MSDTPETDEKSFERWGYEYVCADFARTLERQRDEARAEAQRLRETILRILPGMKAQRPPALGAWNWPYAVKELEEALAGPTVATAENSPRRIMTAHGKEWWVHDGADECPCDHELMVEFLFRYELGSKSFEPLPTIGKEVDWGNSDDSLVDVIAWRPADAPDKLPREGGEG